MQPMKFLLPPQCVQLIIFVLLIVTMNTGCKKEKDLIYELKEIESIPPNTDKNKLKSPAQYLSILYANVFQTALSSNELVQLTNIVEAFGDKDLIHEVIISNFMNRPAINLPTDAEMRDDMEGFIEETYKRFFVRPPSELEKTYFKNYIEANENITPELVYFAFSISNEYQFY